MEGRGKARELQRHAREAPACERCGRAQAGAPAAHRGVTQLGCPACSRPALPSSLLMRACTSGCAAMLYLRARGGGGHKVGAGNMV